MTWADDPLSSVVTDWAPNRHDVTTSYPYPWVCWFPERTRPRLIPLLAGAWCLVRCCAPRLLAVGASAPQPAAPRVP